MKVDFVNTNIVNVSADAIVLPANTRLKEGSGTSRAIFEAAGRKKLKQACEKLGTCEVGSAVPTLAYGLNAKYIIHAVVPKWVDGEHDEYDLLSSAYLSALTLADVMGCSSIAFPLLASGNNGYDLAVAFQIAKESIESYTGTKLEHVTLVLYGTRIVSLVREQGYTVNVIPEDLHREEKREAHKAKVQKMMEEGKDIAQAFLDDQIQKGLDYLKEQKNREKILAAAISIVKLVFTIINKKVPDEK